MRREPRPIPFDLILDLLGAVACLLLSFMAQDLDSSRGQLLWFAFIGVAVYYLFEFLNSVAAEIRGAERFDQ